MEQNQERQRAPNSPPTAKSGATTQPRQDQRGPNPPRQDNRTPNPRQDQRAPDPRGADPRNPAHAGGQDRGGQDRGGQRPPADRGNDRANDRGNDRAPQSRPNQDRAPQSRPNEDPIQADRGRDDRSPAQREYQRPPHEMEQEQDTNGQALATREDQNAGGRGLAPTTQGMVASISPREQRNFITLVSTNSASARRGECEPGLYHSRNLGSFKTVTAEVIGCFYRQRYQAWDDRAQVFQNYCEAAAPTIELLYGEGQPGGRCTECELTKWRETRIEGTNRTKNQPPLCAENVVFDLFIHEVAARAFWEVSSSDNLDTIRNTINILNDRYGWGKYVIQLYSTMQMSSRNEPRFTPHIRHRADINAFDAPNVVDASGHLVSDAQDPRALTDAREYDPDQGQQAYHYPAPEEDPADHWQPADEEDLPF